MYVVLKVVHVHVNACLATLIISYSCTSMLYLLLFTCTTKINLEY